MASRALGHVSSLGDGYRRQQGGYNLYSAVDEKCGFMTPTAKVEVWSTIAETYIPDTTKTFAESCSPDRAAYDGKIPDIDKFPHWFEPKNSKVEAPRYYHKDQADQIATTDPTSMTTTRAII